MGTREHHYSRMRRLDGHKPMIPPRAGGRMPQQIGLARWVKVLRACVVVVWLCYLSWHAMQGRLVAYSDELYFHCLFALFFMTGMYWGELRRVTRWVRKAGGGAVLGHRR